MSSSRTLHIKTYILLFLLVSVGSIGNTILDKGMKDIGTVDVFTRAGFLSGAQHIVTSGTIWVGIVCMLLFMIFHMLVLSSAVSYALVPILGYVWLGEAVPPLRSVGIALIVFGVVLVSRTPPRTTEPLPNLAGTRRP